MKNYTRAEKYKILKQYGYSPKEADKFRNLGNDKFREKLQNSPKMTQTKSKTYQQRYEQIDNKIELYKQSKMKKVTFKKATHNQTVRYHYVISLDMVTPEGEKYVKQIVYATNKLLTMVELKEEINEYIDLLKNKYLSDRVIKWQLLVVYRK